MSSDFQIELSLVRSMTCDVNQDGDENLLNSTPPPLLVVVEREKNITIILLILVHHNVAVIFCEKEEDIRMRERECGVSTQTQHIVWDFRKQTTFLQQK